MNVRKIINHGDPRHFVDIGNAENKAVRDILDAAVGVEEWSLCRDHADGSGWNGQLGRSRRQLAAEFRHRPRTHQKLHSRRT